MRHTIAGHIAREYRRAGVGVDDREWPVWMTFDGAGIEEMRVRR